MTEYGTILKTNATVVADPSDNKYITHYTCNSEGINLAELDCKVWNLVDAFAAKYGFYVGHGHSWLNIEGYYHVMECHLSTQKEAEKYSELKFYLGVDPNGNGILETGKSDLLAIFEATEEHAFSAFRDAFYGTSVWNDLVK